MKILFPVILAMICGLSMAQSISEQDVQRLKSYAVGEYEVDTIGKGKRIEPGKLSIKPFWPTRKDGVWLLVTETAQKKAEQQDNFFVWHFYRESNEVLLLQLLQFKEADRAKELVMGTKKDTDIFLYDLKSLNSCELYLSKDKFNNYTGTGKGKDCYLESEKAEYIVFQAVFKKNTLSWFTKGFDKDDKQVLGPMEEYSYNKIVGIKKKR
jgi:CpeT/CpcT family (DUF1001)